jgi:hypothetical protein
MATILPCLKDPAWGGKDGTVNRRLWDKEPLEFVPWVGFGYDHEHSFEFLPCASLAELKKTQVEVEREAMRNLRARRASWEPWNVKLGWFKKLRMLACGNDFLAAERILDPIFLREAQRRLGARGLVVGVPRRGSLMATDALQGADRIAAFLAIVWQQYREGGSPPVSPLGFAVTDGRIVAVVDTVARAMAQATPDAEADDGDGDEPYVSRICATDRATGLETPTVIVVHADFDRLAQAAIDAFASTLSDYQSREKWSGEIRFNIPADTPGLSENLPRLRAHLAGLASEVSAASGRPLRVTIEADQKAGF